MKPYIVCKERILGDLEESVSQHIARGYSPIGGAGLQRTNDPGLSYWFQAMYCKPTKKRKPRKQTEYTVGFEALWKEYPSRAGSNPKIKAFHAYMARHKDFIAILAGTRRYAAYCDATGKTGTELVMQAQRFFGVNKEYENSWDIPVQQVKSRIPRDDTQLEAFAVAEGLHEPGKAPQHLRNAYDYRKWIESKMGETK